MCHSADLKMWPFLKVLFVDCKSPLLRLKWVIVANASGLLNKIVRLRIPFRVFVFIIKMSAKFANIEVVNLRWFAIINRLNEQKIITMCCYWSVRKMIKCLWDHVLKMFNWLRYLKVCEWGRRNVFLRTRWECTRQLILIYICKSQRLKIKEWYSTLFSKHFMLKGLFGHVLKFNSVVQIRFILFNFQMVMRIEFLVTPTIVYCLNHKNKYKLYPTYEYIRLNVISKWIHHQIQNISLPFNFSLYYNWNFIAVHFINFVVRNKTILTSIVLLKQ